MTSINIKTIAKSCLDILEGLPNPKTENDLCILTFEPSDELNKEDWNLRVQIDKLNDGSYELSDYTHDGTSYDILLDELYKNIDKMEKEIGPVAHIQIQSEDTIVYNLKLDYTSDSQKKENKIIDKVLDIFENYEIPSMENMLDRSKKTNNPEFIKWFLLNNISNINLLKKYM